jgi:very-short-patch-repair endonuclease
LRRNATEAEQTLWRLLRDRRLADFKFRRQVPIGRYIADFVCYAAKLVVELDGSQHAENERDVARDDELRRHGFRVLRVWNSDLTSNRNGVLDAIWAALHDRTPSSALRAPSPTRGEGRSWRNGATDFPSPLVGEGGGEADG